MDSLVLTALSVRSQLMERSPLTMVRQNRHVTFSRSGQREKNPYSHLWQAFLENNDANLARHLRIFGIIYVIALD